jgi:hypothetical protein
MLRALILLIACASAYADEILVLQLRVLEGEGLIQAAGARSSRPIVVQVSDETGKPVEGAAVSFRLPESGPTARFRNGLKTEIAVTGPSGLASVRHMQWERAAGAVSIRVIAAKERARAGVIISQYVR